MSAVVAPRGDGRECPLRGRPAFAAGNEVDVVIFKRYFGIRLKNGGESRVIHPGVDILKYGLSFIWTHSYFLFSCGSTGFFNGSPGTGQPSSVHVKGRIWSVAIPLFSPS